MKFEGEREKEGPKRTRKAKKNRVKGSIFTGCHITDEGEYMEREKASDGEWDTREAE